MASTTTLKLLERLKVRIARLAKETLRSAHSLMLEVLAREVQREERMRACVRETQNSDVAIPAGAEVYRADDVHAWLGDWRKIPKRHAASRGAKHPLAGCHVSWELR